MIFFRLFGAAATDLALEGDGPTATFSRLRITGSSVFSLLEPITLPDALFSASASGELVLNPSAVADDVFIEMQFESADPQFRFLGRDFDATLGVAAQLNLRIPFRNPDTAGVPWSESPLAVITIRGHLVADGSGGGASVTLNADIETALTIERPPQFSGISLPTIPRLAITLPDFGITLPPLSIPLPSLSFPSFPITLPSWDWGSGTGLGIDCPVRAGFCAVRLTHTADGALVIDVTGAWIETDLGRVTGNLRVTRDASGVRPAESWFDLYDPDAIHLRRLQFSGWVFDAECVAFAWTEGQLGSWVGLILPPSVANSFAGEASVILRLLWRDGFEARLEWQTADASASPIHFPAVDLTLPKLAATSLIVQRDAAGIWRTALAATFTGADAIGISVPFTLAHPSESADESESREVTPARNKSASLVELELKSRAFTPAANPDPSGFETPDDPDADTPLPDDPTVDDGEAYSTLLLAVVELPALAFRFLRECESVAPLNLNAPSTLASPTGLADALPLLKDRWSLAISAKPHLEYELPLFSPDQHFALTLQSVEADLPLTGAGTPSVRCVIAAKLTLGVVESDTEIEVDFDPEQMTLRTKGPREIPFYITASQGACKAPADTPQLCETIFGLDWRFISAPRQDGENRNRLFSLIVAGSNFELRQAPGSRIVVSFTRATSADEPLLFTVTEFRVGPRGISFSADVSDSPARLRGVNTAFRFTGGTLRMEDSRVQDFTLRGSGTLPPALVGHAVVDIALQFGQRGSSIELLSAAAQLSGGKLLKCSETRFQFQIDAIGLRFVNDGGYQFYFTLTGKARFVPFPGDDPSGPLAWLPTIEMQLAECPLTGDMSVLERHIRFAVELPQKVTFDFLGAFQMEVRGIGFIPRFEAFDPPAAAMVLTGQIRFADGAGDAVDAAFDFHNLYIGLPKAGDFFPRLYCRELGVKLRLGSVFALDGAVSFLDGTEIEPGIRAEGFLGRGTIMIQGLPGITVTFAFVRVQRPSDGVWVRAWFVYAEATKLSIEIPPFRLFLREVGMGFGYRYTLAAIKAADEAGDTRTLIKQLDELSKRQGDLSRWDRWRVDLETDGGPPWTVVLRGLIAQNSASEGVTDYNADIERELPSLFVLDIVLALRNDLTFLMTGRGWLFTNYNDFLEADPDDPNGLRVRPLLTGTLLLQPRRSRFLARLRSSERPMFGGHPPMLPMLQQALEQSYFSATLLLEPGLYHLELGWPNVLRWRAALGPLEAEFSGGAIFRVSRTEVVNGLSFMARGSLSLSAGFSGGMVGARLAAMARVAFGARYIGVIAFDRPLENSALYAAVGVEIVVNVSIEVWIRINVGFCKITLSFSFSFEVSFTALVEIGVTLNALPGTRGTATLGLQIMGRQLRFGIHVGVFEDTVNRAFQLTERFLKVGLEASEVEPLPGSSPIPQALSAPAPAAIAASMSGVAAPEIAAEAASAVGSASAPGVPVPPPDGIEDLAATVRADRRPLDDADGTRVISGPGYHLLIVPWTAGRGSLMLLVPAAPSRAECEKGNVREGFLPVPPEHTKIDERTEKDFHWTRSTFDGIQRWSREDMRFMPAAANEFAWSLPWLLPIPIEVVDEKGNALVGATGNPVLANFLRYAFLPKPGAEEPQQFGDFAAVGDPLCDVAMDGPEDSRVQHGSSSDFEAAVRGAEEQLEGAPYLRHDPALQYEQDLRDAFDNRTSVYSTSGTVPTGDPAAEREHEAIQQAHELRGTIIQRLLSDIEQLASRPQESWPTALDQTDVLALQLGLVFRVDDETVLADTSMGVIRQIISEKGTLNPTDQSVSIYNPAASRFDRRIPVFGKVKQFAAESTIAIAWELSWPDAHDAKDPVEHHLRYYHVMRRPIDGRGPSREFRVKDTPVLRRDADGNLVAIAPRFKLTDHFSEPGDTSAANLPLVGQSYLYTITPIDLSATASPRPLSVVATRRRTTPPPAPVTPELRVNFEIPADLEPLPFNTEMPKRLTGIRFVLWFTDARRTDDAPIESPDTYYLNCRAVGQWPVGSWPADADLTDATGGTAPASSARALRSDIEIRIKASLCMPTQHPDGSTRRRYVFQNTELERLLSADGSWAPVAWHMSLQSSIGTGEASRRSPLVAVSLVATVTPEAGPMAPAAGDNKLEWHPSHLELPARPHVFPTVAPEDGLIFDDDVAVPLHHVPPTGEIGNELVAADGGAVFTGFEFTRHPAGLRAALLRWNAAPSNAPDRVRVARTALTAGFHVHAFDADAHEADALARARTFDDRPDLFRLLQQVELVPTDDLRVVPNNNLQPDQWEAWYPSTSRRLAIRASDGTLPPPERLRDAVSRWHSWSTSTLDWPEASHLVAVPAPQPVSATFVRCVRATMQVTVNGTTARITAKEGVLDALVGLDWIFVQVGGVLFKGRVARWPSAGESVDLVFSAAAPPAGGGKVVLAADEPTPSDAFLDLDDGSLVLPANVRAEVAGFAAFTWMSASGFMTRGNNGPRRMVPLAPDSDAWRPEPWCQFKPESWLGKERRRGIQFGAVAGAQLHPFIARLIADLCDEVARQLTRDGELPPAGPNAQGMEGVLAELLAGPAIHASTPGELINETPPAGDPFGWNALKRLGLSTAFMLRERRTNQLLPAGGPTRAALREVLVHYSSVGGDYITQEVMPHLHIEWLMQPARSVRGARTDTDRSIAHQDLLAAMQVSLRPTARQRYALARHELTRGPNANAEGTITFVAPTTPYFLLDSGPDGVVGSDDDDLSTVSSAESRPIKVATGTPRVFLTRGAPSTLLSALPEGWSLSEPQYFDATNRLAEVFHDQSGEEIEAEPFERFAQYLRFAFPPKDAGAPVVISRGDWLPWLQRFFDHGGDARGGIVNLPSATPVFLQAGAGPWSAIAYPRQPSPLPVALEADGTVRTFVLIDDQWAHAYRYFVSTRGRYDTWWRGLASSAALFPAAGVRAANVERLSRLYPVPPPAMGGLDVVFDRIKPVAPPLVLSSRRLDPPSHGDEPMVPGSVWEVILAKHPEQTLVERNRTLMRQTQFRQIVFSMFRQVGATWRENQQPILDVLGQELVEPAENVVHRLPREPQQLNEVNLAPTSPMTEGARSLALPDRVDTLGHGALVLQWDSPPHFYEHRLVVAAQALHRVSKAVDVIHTTFAYESAPSTARVGAVDVLEGGKTQRKLRLSLELLRYWDTTPAAIRERWQVDDPARVAAGKRLPSSLPDTEVRYEIQIRGDGPIDLIETAVDINHRKTDKNLTGFTLHADGTRLDTPETGMLAPASAMPESAPVTLHADLSRKEQEATRAWFRAAVMDMMPDLLRLPEAAPPLDDPTRFDEFLDEWYPVRIVSADPMPLISASAISNDIKAVLRSGGTTDGRFWLHVDGPVVVARDALTLLYATQPPGDRDAVARLVSDDARIAALNQAMAQNTTTELISGSEAFPLAHLPAGFDRARLAIAPTADLTLQLEGTLTEMQTATLRTFAAPWSDTFKSAVEQLIDRMGDTSITQVHIPGGIAQLHELGATVTADSIGWNGPVRPRQRRMIDTWQAAGVRGAGELASTLGVLNDAGAPWAALSIPGPMPDVLEAVRGLAATNVGGSFNLSWSGGRVLSYRDERTLRDFVNGAADPWRQAIQSLLQAHEQATSTAPLPEGERIPSQQDLWHFSPEVGGRVMIAASSLSWQGWMTPGEAHALIVESTFGADIAAMRRLAGRSPGAGLGGALTLRARRGNAPLVGGSITADLGEA